MSSCFVFAFSKTYLVCLFLFLSFCLASFFFFSIHFLTFLNFKWQPLKKNSNCFQAKFTFTLCIFITNKSFLQDALTHTFIIININSYSNYLFYKTIAFLLDLSFSFRQLNPWSPSCSVNPERFIKYKNKWLDWRVNERKWEWEREKQITLTVVLIRMG